MKKQEINYTETLNQVAADVMVYGEKLTVVQKQAINETLRDIHTLFSDPATFDPNKVFGQSAQDAIDNMFKVSMLDKYVISDTYPETAHICATNKLMHHIFMSAEKYVTE